MIISNTQTQNLSLFFIGSNVIMIMNNHTFNKIDPIVLYNKYCENFGVISFSYFMYGLDWLFICNLINITNDGDVILCS